jgi:hypothetical protein
MQGPLTDLRTMPRIEVLPPVFSDWQFGRKETAMTPKHKSSLPLLRRRDICFGALAFGATAFLAPRTSVAEGALQAWWDDITGDLKDAKEDIRESPPIS